MQNIVIGIVVMIILPLTFALIVGLPLYYFVIKPLEKLHKNKNLQNVKKTGLKQFQQERDDIEKNQKTNNINNITTNVENNNYRRCGWCGKQIDKDSTSCRFCGHKVEVNNIPLKNRKILPEDWIKVKEILNKTDVKWAKKEHLYRIIDEINEIKTSDIGSVLLNTTKILLTESNKITHTNCYIPNSLEEIKTKIPYRKLRYILFYLKTILNDSQFNPKEVMSYSIFYDRYILKDINERYCNENYVNNEEYNEGDDNEEEDDENFWSEIAEYKSTMDMLRGSFSSGGKSEKEKRIERKRKEVAELEKTSDWQRQADPAWDTESYTSNDWDDEEKKLDHKIGNLKQQNISYGNWQDFEDRRTYKDESDPTEFSEDDQ